MANIVPAQAAILKWALTQGPSSGFFMLIETTTHIATAFIEEGELKIFAGNAQKEGFTLDDVQELGEMTEDTGKGRSAIVWCWGMTPGAGMHGKLAGYYRNLRTITAEELRGEEPLELKEKTKIQEKEAWIVNHMLNR
jgi:hypothetical protein